MQSSFGVVMLQRSIWILVLCVGTAGTTRALTADEAFPNELNSSVDEPQILLKEETSRVPVRMVSTRTIQTDDSLVRLVFDTREAQRRRLLSTTVHTPWQIMHGLLGLRQDFIISHNEKSVSGLDWIASGPQFRNEYWFEKTEFGGRAHPYSIPYAFEGHVNQFLAILSMSGLSLDHEFQTADGPITMRDMLAHAQKTVNDREEITWTLWALSRYLPPDAQWRNASGELWSIERLVKLQVDKPLQGSPCGGTHGLFALAHARNVYLRKGLPLRGVWIEAEQKIRRYIQTARMQQTADGTLSSNFFRGREYKADFDKRMASAGHILEFLMIALPQEELSQPWVRRALEATCKDLMQNRHEYVSCSPLYHTVNALSTYLDRVAPAPQPEQLVQDTDQTKTIGQSRPPKSDPSSTVPVTTATADAKTKMSQSATPSASSPESSVTADESTADSATPADSTNPTRTEINGPKDDDILPVPVVAADETAGMKTPAPSAEPALQLQEAQPIRDAADEDRSDKVAPENLAPARGTMLLRQKGSSTEPTTREKIRADDAVNSELDDAESIPNIASVIAPPDDSTTPRSKKSGPPMWTASMSSLRAAASKSDQNVQQSRIPLVPATSSGLATTPETAPKSNSVTGNSTASPHEELTSEWINHVVRTQINVLTGEKPSSVQPKAGQPKN